MTRHKQQGFTLVEVTAVLIIAAIVTVTAIRSTEQKWRNVIVENAAEEVRAVFSAAQRYRVATGNWPANTGQLVVGNYMHAQLQTTPWGGNYTFSNVGSDFQISFNANEAKYANPLSGRLPFGNVVGNLVTTRIVPPGNEASLEQLYARDGSRPLTGTMNANKNNINNINTVSATTVNGTTINGSTVSGTTVNGTTINSRTVNGTTINSSTVNATNFNGGTFSGARVSATADMRAPIFYDSDNTIYRLDSSATSRLNYIDANLMRLRNSYTEGAACGTQQVGTTASGELMSCVSRIWTKPGNNGNCTFIGRGGWCEHQNNMIVEWGTAIVTGTHPTIRSWRATFHRRMSVVHTVSATSVGGRGAAFVSGHNTTSTWGAVDGLGFSVLASRVGWIAIGTL